MQNKLGRENGSVKLRLINAFWSLNVKVNNKAPLIIFIKNIHLYMYLYKNYLLKKPTRTNIICGDCMQSSKTVNV